MSYKFVAKNKKTSIEMLALVTQALGSGDAIKIEWEDASLTIKFSDPQLHAELLKVMAHNNSDSGIEMEIVNIDN